VKLPMVSRSVRRRYRRLMGYRYRVPIVSAYIDRLMKRAMTGESCRHLSVKKLESD
jgi:hypothetical protein